MVYTRSLHTHTHTPVQPGFYSPNWLFLGKCHMNLGNREKAREWLKKAAEYQSELADDIEVKLEHEL